MSLQAEIERLGTEYGTTLDRSWHIKAQTMWQKYSEPQRIELIHWFMAAFEAAKSVRPRGEGTYTQADDVVDTIIIPAKEP